MALVCVRWRDYAQAAKICALRRARLSKRGKPPCVPLQRCDYFVTLIVKRRQIVRSFDGDPPQLRGVWRRNKTENQSETCGLLKLEAVKDQIDLEAAVLGYPQMPILEAVGVGAIRNFEPPGVIWIIEAAEAATLITSRGKNEARFGLSGPSYLLYWRSFF